MAKTKSYGTEVAKRRKLESRRKAMKALRDMRRQARERRELELNHLMREDSSSSSDMEDQSSPAPGDEDSNPVFAPVPQIPALQNMMLRTQEPENPFIPNVTHGTASNLTSDGMCIIKCVFKGFYIINCILQMTRTFPNG